MAIPVYLGTIGVGAPTTLVPPNAAIWELIGLAGSPLGGPGQQPPALSPYLWTWDVTPAGPGGVTIFRGITVSFWTQGAFGLGVQPLVDGFLVGQTSVFTSAQAGEQKCEVEFNARGSRLSAQVTFGGPQWIQLVTGPAFSPVTGSVELRDITYAHVPLRAFPK